VQCDEPGSSCKKGAAKEELQKEGEMQMKEVYMKHRAAIMSVAVIVAMICVAGCDSQQKSGASAQQAGGGSAHLSAVSFTGTFKAEVKDPGDGETAFTVDVPSGWKIAGTILRPRGCHGIGVPADGLSYTSLGPDGVTALGQLPGTTWSWASDGVTPQGPKCQPVGITTAAGYLLNIAVPNIHPDARIIGMVPLTEQMKQGLEAQRRNMEAATNSHARQLVDTARVRVEYELNGQTVEEQMGTVINCNESYFPAYPQMRRPARTVRTCYAHGTYIKRAPKGQLDALLARNVPLAQIDHAWDAHIAQQMRENFAAYQQASDAQFASIQKHFQEQTAAMVKHGQDVQASIKQSTDRAMANDAATVNATSHMAHQQVLDSLGRADFIDPNTGRKIETSNQFDHNWISTDGNTAVLNSNPNFDPNGVVNPNRESFVQLIPAN